MALREGLRAGALEWYEEYAPRHFDTAAASTYGYPKRSLPYLRRKQKAGLRGPLQFSGTLKRIYLSGAQVKAWGDRAIVKAQAPDYIQINRRKGSSYPDIKKELTTTTEFEREELAPVLKAAAVDWLRREGTSGIRRNKKGAGRPAGS
jgi:hypothetical protein